MDKISDASCIVKAFESNNISIIKDENNKELFRASDVANVLEMSHVYRSTQNFTEKERIVQKCNTSGGPQDIIFLTTQGVYRLLYMSKKPIAQKFREWVGDILDDIIFNNSIELTRQLKEFELKLNNQKQITVNSVKDTLLYSYDLKNVVYLIKIKDTLYKYGFSDDIQNRFKSHIREIGKDIQLIYCIESKNNVLLEKHLKKYLEESNIKINQIINTKNQTELFEINDIQTIINILELYNKDINQDKEKIKNDGLLLEVEKLQLNLDIIFQENYKIKNDELLSENEKLKEELANFKLKGEKPIVKVQEIIQENPIILKVKEIEIPKEKKKRVNKNYPRSQEYLDKLQTPEFKLRESQRKKIFNNTPEMIEKRRINYQANREKIDNENYRRTKLTQKCTLAKLPEEKQKFLEWLKINIIKSQNDLIWKQVFMKYLKNIATSPLISKIYRLYFEEYVRKSYNIKIIYIPKIHGYHLFSLI